MMDFRQRLEQSRIRPVNSEPPAEADDNGSCPYFATERGGSPACLDLRMADGSRRAVPYSYCTGINFEPDKGIELLTADRHILVTGRNLSALYECLIAYRVKYIQENVGNDAQEDGLFVDEIRYHDL